MAQQVGNVAVIGHKTKMSDYTDAELAVAALDSSGSTLSRGIASEILLRVAVHGEIGNYPHAIPPEAVGRALHRLITNWTPNPEAYMPMDTSVVEVIGRILAGFYNRPVR